MSPSTSTGRRGINSLPAEVLLDIFEQYLKPEPVLDLQGAERTLPALTPKDIEYISGRGENSPFVIDQVCGTWRQLARGYSGLYTDIHVVNPTPQDVARVRTMLELSKDRPLRVFLKVNEFPQIQLFTHRGGLQAEAMMANASADGDCLFPWHQIVKLVFANAHRVEKLYLQVPVGPKWKGWDYTFPLGRDTDWDALAFPLLTTLHVQDKVSAFHASEDTFFKPLVTRACATSPRLTDMRLDKMFALVNIIGQDPLNGLGPCASMIPWKNLTSLTISIQSVKEMLPILRLCPSLQELYLEPDMCWSSSTEEAVGEPVLLPNLWCLVLSVNGESNDNTFLPLSYLRVPALKSLSLHTPGKRVLSGLDDTSNPPRKSVHLLGALTAFHRLNPDCRIQTFSSFQNWDPRDQEGYRQILSLPIFGDLISFKNQDS